MQKRIGKITLALCGILIGVGAAGMNTEMINAQTKNNQVPVISGTSYIQVLKGDGFDAENILSRVYAMDYEDGDLTQAVQMVSSNVQKDQTGTYSVVYEVADRQGAKDTFTTTVEVVDAYNEFGKYMQKTVYTKENAKHLLDVELYRGYYHDRQHLGMYLNEGATLYVSLLNGQEVNEGRTTPVDLRIDILGDDSDIEKSYVIPSDGNWLAIQGTDVTEDMVPFIRTPECNVEPILQYYYLDGNMEALTYYGYGDDEAAFFNTWNSNDQQYAVVEGERVTMLIPRRDKDSILNNQTTRPEYQFKTVDGMLDYYKALQDQYDEFAGLVWDADAGVDKNIRAKYFAKADATGVGAAYYSGALYTAENSESMNGYLKRDWMTMHEVAHGYDSSLAYGNVPLVECINNMFGYFYEKETLAEGDTGWSSMQYFDLVEQRYMDQIQEGKIFTNMDFDARLYGMLNALTFGDAKEMMSDLYHAWRVDGGKSVPSDFLVEQFSDTTGYNLVPYFEEYGLEISELVKSRIYEKNYPIANRFAYHFEDTSAASDAKAVVGDAVNGLYGLAASSELEVLNQKGSLKVNIQIDDLEQIKGKELCLYDGKKEVAKAKVEGDEVVFQELPIGTYRMMLPTAKSIGYYVEYGYVTISANKEAFVTAVYRKNTNNAMKDDMAIVLQGLSDKVFSTITTNIDQETITVTTENIQPHYYFTDPAVPYGMIRVESPDGKQLYTRSYIGSETYQYEVEHFEAPIGSKIYVKHLEIGGPTIPERRVQVKSRILASVIKEYMVDYVAEDYTVVFEVTEQGLRRVDQDKSSFDDVRAIVIDQLLTFMEQIEGAKEERGAYQKVKAMIVGLVATFDENTQSGYMTDYPYLFEEETIVEPTPTPTPTPVVPENPFSDVAKTDYFYNAVLWAVNEKVTSGYTDTLFAPNMTCTRAQVVTFLWRANGRPEPEITENPFSDVTSDQYYYKAILWAVEKGITKGVTEHLFAPDETITRGQFASFLWRLEGRPEYTVENPFADLPENSYYYNAVLWAYENKITAGYYQDLFAPDMGCSRCQVVSFLYRAR